MSASFKSATPPLHVLNDLLIRLSANSCASQPGINPIHLKSARDLAAKLNEADYTLVYGGGTVGIMGELARTLVSLSGPEAVHGVIPRALISTEKGYDGTSIGEQARTHNNHVKTDGGSQHGPEVGDGKVAEKHLSSTELDRIDASTGSTTLRTESDFGSTTVVPDMHTRKRLMAQFVIRGGKGSGFVALAGGYGTIEEVMEMVTWNQLGIHPMPIVLVNIDGYWDGLLRWVDRAVKEGYVREGNRGILVEVKRVEDVVPALTG